MSTRHGKVAFVESVRQDGAVSRIGEGAAGVEGEIEVGEAPRPAPNPGAEGPDAARARRVSAEDVVDERPPAGFDVEQGRHDPATRRSMEASRARASSRNPGTFAKTSAAFALS